jgi:hypothetical protein
MAENIWREMAVGRNKQFRQLLETPRYQKILDEKFIGSLVEARERYESRAQKVQILQATIALFLLFALLLPDTRLSFLGVGLEARSLREALLIIFAVVQLNSFFDDPKNSFLREVVEAFVSKVGKDDEELKRLLRVRYNIASPTNWLLSRIDPTSLTRGSRTLVVVVGISMLLWLFMTVGAVVILRVAALVSIIADPTISLTLSIFVAVYVAAVGLLVGGMQAMNHSIW